MPRRFCVALATLGLGLATIGAWGQRPEAPRKKVLVELFTSQG
jgi:hypothetical protein